MRTLLFLLVSIIIAINVTAQGVGINTNGAMPDTSAMLDVSGTDKGVLINRVALDSINDATTILGPATSLILYNDGTGGLVPAGFYYNSGTPASPNWARVGDVSGTGQAAINKTTSQAMGAAFTTIKPYQSSTTNGNTTGRFTFNLTDGSITVTNAGFYHIKGVVGMVLSHQTNAAGMAIFKNYSILQQDFKSMGEQAIWPAGGDDWLISAQGIYYLNAGDIITLSSAGTTNTVINAILTITTYP